jgi:predicted Zn finger-like uncharacterized protein
MMLVTKCPNCHTVFKVVSDQLKISEGWVRCGQCTEIFDTTLNLREWDPEKPEDNIPSSIVSHEVEPAWQPSAIESGEAFKSVPMEPEPQAEPLETAIAFAEPVSVATNDLAADLPPAQASHSEPDASFGKSLDNNEFSHPLIDSQIDELVAERRIDADDGDTDMHNAATNAGFADHHSFTADAERGLDPHDSLNFLNRAQTPSFWDRSIVRKTLGLISVVLALALVGQFLLHERDRIATYVPSLRTVLDDLCQGFGCRVMPLKQIESMTVESSSFNRFRGETYRLGFVIRNSSDLELAKPALELTLTDSQDQAVYRRVLLPAELDPKSSTMARGEEWSESLVISLTDGNNPAQLGSSKSVSGYRLLAFYP